jgi:hypothetical protein
MNIVCKPRPAVCDHPSVQVLIFFEADGGLSYADIRADTADPIGQRKARLPSTTPLIAGRSQGAHLAAFGGVEVAGHRSFVWQPDHQNPCRHGLARLTRQPASASIISMSLFAKPTIVKRKAIIVPRRYFTIYRTSIGYTAHHSRPPITRIRSAVSSPLSCPRQYPRLACATVQQKRPHRLSLTRDGDDVEATPCWTFFLRDCPCGDITKNVAVRIIKADW